MIFHTPKLQNLLSTKGLRILCDIWEFLTASLLDSMINYRELKHLASVFATMIGLQQRRGICRRGGIAVFLVVLITSAPAVHAEGIPIGKWIFLPSVDTLWESDDNLFLDSEGKNHLSASSIVLAANLNFMLPFRKSHFKINYTPQFRKFIAGDVTELDILDLNYTSHFLDLETKLVFSNGLLLSFEEHYADDTFDRIDEVTVGEIAFSNVRYQSNKAHIEATKQLGPRHSAGILMKYDNLVFDEAIIISVGKRDQFEAELNYVYEMSPIARLSASYMFGQGSQDSTDPLAIPVTTTTEKFDIQGVSVAFHGALGRHGLADFRLGHSQWNFDEQRLQDFSGVVGQMRYRLTIRDQFRLLTEISRYPVQSLLRDTKYFDSSFLHLQLTRFKGKRLFYGVEGSYRENDYPKGVTTNFRRNDKIFRYDLSIGYRFFDTLQVEARYRIDDRESNLDTAAYDARSFVIQTSFGWF